MAFIYEINGQRIQFDKKPTERDIDEAAASMSRPKPETAAQTFGRSAASTADSVLNTVTGTLDAAAYPLARAFGRSPEQATAETTSPKDVFGRAFGVSNTAGYQQAPLRQLGTAIGETFGETVVQPVSRATGLPATDVASMAGMLPIPAAQPAARAVAATGRGVAKAAQVPVDVVKGAAGRASGYIAEPGVAPKGYQVQSSRVPLTETYIPQQGMQMLRENPNMLPADLPAAMAPQPIGTLPKVPVALSGGEMPLAGQGARAFGERLGETYRNPVTAAVDLGSLAFSGLPIYSLGRMAMAGVQGMADRRLGKFGFEALTPEQRVRMEAGQNPFNDGQTPVAAPMAAPVAAPVAPQQIPRLGYSPTPSVLYGTDTGQIASTPQAAQFAGLREKYAPQPVAPTPSAAPAAPIKSAGDIRAEALRAQLAAKRAEPIAPVAPAALPEAAPTAPVSASSEILSDIAGLAAKTPGDVREGIRKSTVGGVTTIDKKISIDKPVFNDLASQYGVKLDWDTLPKEVNTMPIGQARKFVERFVWNNVQDKIPTETRGPQQRTLQKQAEAEQGITGKEAPSAEVISDMERRAQLLMGDKYRAPKKAEPTLTQAPVVNVETVTPQRSIKITFDDLYNEMTNNPELFDPETIANTQFNTTAKTITDIGDGVISPSLEKWQENNLPKNTVWEKSVQQWSPDGSKDISTTYYNKTNKKNPVQYKAVQDSDTMDVDLYKLEKDQWKKIEQPLDTMGTIGNPYKTSKDARAIIDEKTKNNKAYDIWYKKGSTKQNETFIPEGQTFKLDPSIKMYKMSHDLNGVTTATGTYKDSIPAKAIIDTDKMTVEIYTTVNGKEQLHKKFNIPKGK